MADVLRSCTKTGCRWPAAASLSYRYATRQVWLLDLAAAADPSLYDLCPHHADHLTVPNGWERVDDRTIQPVMVEPSAFDRAEEAARRRWAQPTSSPAALEPPAVAAPVRERELVTAGGGRSRYAALVEQLPQLAAAHRPPGPSGPGDPDDLDEPATPPTVRDSRRIRPESRTVPATAPPPEPTEPDRPLADLAYRRPTTGAGRPPAVTPAHELAPLAQDPVAWGAADEPRNDHPRGPDEPMPGQLSIPVGDLEDRPPGVVLPFELAGPRRRGNRS